MNEIVERSSRDRPQKHWWKKIKFQLSACLIHTPKLRVLLKRVWVSCLGVLLQSLYWRVLLWNFITGNYCKCIQYNKTHWVSPVSIEYTGLTEFNIHYCKGRVITGDWDRLEKVFTRLDIYIAIEEVLSKGKSWPETEFHQRIIKKIANGQIYWNCVDEFSFNQRCRNLELLFKSIKDNGYKTQEELLQGQYFDYRKKNDEIIVSIGRDGDLLFSNSAHRLAIVKILGLEKVPIKISVRHPDWIQFIKELSSYIDKNDIPLSHDFRHPDIEDLKSSKKGETLYEIISKNIPVKKGKLIDLGAGLGYFCHRFQNDGFNCYASECSSFQLKLLKQIKKVERYNFSITETPVLKTNYIRNNRFDVVLALNSFHYFLKTEETFNELILFLKNLDAKELYFQSPTTLSTTNRCDYKQYNPEEFVGVILEYSSLSNAELIGYTNDNTPLYKLYT